MRVIPLVAATLSAACLVAPAAEAKHRKPMSGSYPLTLPVPYAGESPSGSHCQDAPEGLSKDTRSFKLPAAGQFKLSLAGYTGDWVIELSDAKGRIVASAAGVNTSGTPTSVRYKKKSTKSENLTVAICNYLGGPQGNVAWVFTFDK
ncbi:MAG TPA: hypothetical protein VNA20_17085 [Frankiaceae bacterium]|nr:hypothetical protein [Frankiaceae bacterium]